MLPSLQIRIDSSIKKNVLKTVEQSSASQPHARQLLSLGCSSPCSPAGGAKAHLFLWDTEVPGLSGKENKHIGFVIG